MAVLTPCTSPMDLLERWDQCPDRMTTSEIIRLTGLTYHSAPYRWMMKLAICGYFQRHNAPQPRGGKLVCWTITPKGRAAITELKRIHA